MGKGDTSINYPAQPTYGEGMADAMKAQMEMLTGKGDFEDIYSESLGRGGGRLQDILREYEAPLRKEAAQIDTDVLRETIKGGEQKVRQATQEDVHAGRATEEQLGKYYIPGATPVTTEEFGGAPTQSAGGRYQVMEGGVLDTDSGGMVTPSEYF